MRKSDWAKVAAFAIAAGIVTPASAKDAPAQTEPTKCAAPYGSIAITDGDQQGWTQFNLSSPRGMLAALIQQSGCFTLYSPASGRPADYLLSAIAGSKEEVDKTMNMAKGALTEGLVRSGAAAQVVGRVPFGGALLGAFGGLGGKKKTFMAGLRIMSPASGQTLISGSGETSKSVVKILGANDWVAGAQGGMGGYASSDDGKMLIGAFVVAYNALVAQGDVLAATRPAASSGTPGGH